jgi:hypothetical protein
MTDLDFYEWSEENEPKEDYQLFDKEPEEKMTSNFVVKDTAEHLTYPSGMNRGDKKGKPNYRLIDLDFLKRLAEHLTKGAEIHGRDNWRKANSEEELRDCLDASMRHLVQYLNNETDEDHAMAVVFNLMVAEYIKDKLQKKEETSKSSFHKIAKYQFQRKPKIRPDDDPSWDQPYLEWTENPDQHLYLAAFLDECMILESLGGPDCEVTMRSTDRDVQFFVYWPNRKYKLCHRIDREEFAQAKVPVHVIFAQLRKKIVEVVEELERI